METFYTILRADGSSERLSVDWSDHPTLEQLHSVLDPVLGTDNFEHVYVLGENDKPRDMFVDEIGHWKHLTRNDAATELYRRATLRRYPQMPPEAINYIVGAAVVFDRIVWS